MPGKTGKRAKAPGLCNRCKLPINGGFCREKDGDYHQACWFEDWKDKNRNKPGGIGSLWA